MLHQKKKKTHLKEEHTMQNKTITTITTTTKTHPLRNTRVRKEISHSCFLHGTIDTHGFNKIILMENMKKKHNRILKRRQ